MDDRLKKLLQELANALNESLEDSESIPEVIGKIKKEGYDIFLILEATIGFNKRRPGQPEKSTIEPRSRVNEKGVADLDLTGPDRAFFTALKISLEE